MTKFDLQDSYLICYKCEESFSFWAFEDIEDTDHAQCQNEGYVGRVSESEFNEILCTELKQGYLDQEFVNSEIQDRQTRLKAKALELTGFVA